MAAAAWLWCLLAIPLYLVPWRLGERADLVCRARSKTPSRAERIVGLRHKVVCLLWLALVSPRPTLGLGRYGNRMLGRPCQGLFLPRLSLVDGSGPGGMRPWWDQSAKQGRGAKLVSVC